MSEHTHNRVLLTRSREDCESWIPSLRKRGASPIVFPCISTEVIDNPETRGRLAQAIEKADWLVFTSKRGVSAFEQLCDAELPSALRIAAVGRATAEAAESCLGRIDLVGTGRTAADLADDLIARANASVPATFLLAIAENAPSMLETKLADAGHETLRLDVYRTIPTPDTGKRRAFSTLACDAVLLASPSAVQGFVNQVELDIDAQIYTIGPSTTAAAQNLGLEVKKEAAQPSLEGLMEAMQCPT